MRRKQSRSGFTLLEMMIVIVIIAILAALLIPNFIRARYKAHLSGCQSNERAVVTALELYRTDHDAYPPPGLIAPGHPVFSVSFINPDAVSCPSNDSRYVLDVVGENFTLSCNGLHHLLLPVSPGYPQFSPSVGQLLGP